MTNPIPILNLRGFPTLIDADLAKLYGVETKRLNEQVKRNKERFPADFVFQLSREEKLEVVAKCDHLGKLKFSNTLPYAYTEHGALMASNILNSPEAMTMSVFIVRAFVKQRENLVANAAILKRLAEIDKTLMAHDSVLRDLYRKIQPLLLPPVEKPKRQIGFHIKDGLTAAETRLADELAADGLSIQGKFRAEPLYKRTGKGHFESKTVDEIKAAKEGRP
jgi:hypothetical protein